MIEAKDLRLGNWLMYNGKFWQVDSLSDFPIIGICDDTHESIIGEQSASPIQLSSEILEKCGFVLNGYYYKRQPEFENIEYRLIEFPSGTWIVSKGFINYNHEITAIKYLHQLQNLYFALTNTELIINL